MNEMLVVGNVVSFDVYPTAVLGNNFRNVRIDAILDAETTRYVNGYDAPAIHAMVYPTLPAGVPDNYTRYSYLKITHPNGQVAVIGIPYINESTITSKTVNTISLTIKDVGPSDVAIVTQALAGAGYKVATIDIV